MNPDSVYHLIVDAMTSNEKNVLDVITALSTFLIALIAMIIAYQQYIINRRRFKFETYERKLVVYKVVQKFLIDILREGKTDYPQLGEFYANASEAIFLFDKSVQDKIEEIYKNSIKMISLSQKLYPRDGSDGLPVGEERNKVVEKESELIQWHVNQLNETKELFKKNMALK